MEGDWNRRSLVGEFLVVLVEKIERGEEDEETIEAEELRVSIAMKRKGRNVIVLASASIFFWVQP